jgi:hypothetical protein
MIATMTANTVAQRKHSELALWAKALGWTLFWVAVVFVLFPGLAHASSDTGNATTTGDGGATAAQTRINNVATGWQNIVQGVGVAILILAWSYVGYLIAFGGKTLKDVTPTLMGTTIAGVAPILVGWMFS